MIDFTFHNLPLLLQQNNSPRPEPPLRPESNAISGGIDSVPHSSGQFQPLPQQNESLQPESPSQLDKLPLFSGVNDGDPQPSLNPPSLLQPNDDWTFKQSNVDVPREWCDFYGQKVLIGEHKLFPRDRCVLLDLSFVPRDFFDVSGCKQVKSMTTDRKKLAGEMNGGAMMYQVTDDTFHFSSKQHEQLVFDVVDKVLQEVGNKPPHCPEDRNTISLKDQLKHLAFLATVYLRPQRPHGDYTHKQLDRFLRTAGERFKDCPYPWSIDMPLTDGGMSLLFYGQDKRDVHDSIQGSLDEGLLHKIPERLNVPFQYALLWR